MRLPRSALSSLPHTDGGPPCRRQPALLALLLHALALTLLTLPPLWVCDELSPVLNRNESNYAEQGWRHKWSHALAFAANQRSGLSSRWPGMLPNVAPPMMMTAKYHCPEHKHSQTGKGNIPWVTIPQETQWRLHAVLDKASSGGEVVVAAVGGSVTAGGAVRWQDSYASQFAHLLALAFPAAQVRLELGAKGDTTSALPAFCLEALVGETVDVLFVEFTLNDGVDFHRLKEPTATYENLLRRAAVTYPSAATFGIGFWGQFFSLGRNFYTRHRALAAHYGLGWVAVDPLARAMVKARLSTRAKMTADQKGHPRNETYHMIAQLMLVGMVEAATCESQLRRTRPPAPHPALFSSPTPLTISLPNPVNAILRHAPLPTTTHCDLVGLPKHNSSTGMLQGVNIMKSWQYVSIRWLGAAHPRLDQKLHLIPGKDLPTALRMLRNQHAGLEGGKSVVKGGKEELLVSVKVVSQLMVSMCRESFFQSAYDGTCFPFRILLEPSGTEVPMKPWLGRNYGMFVSSMPLPPGMHDVRVVRRPTFKCKPYACLAAIVGM